MLTEESRWQTSRILFPKFFLAKEYLKRKGGQNEKEIRGYDKNTMNLNFLIENGRRTKYSDSRSKVLNFPLYVGKKWSDIVAKTPKTGGRPSVEQNYLEEYFVSTYESVSVEAGTFMAFRIEYRQHNMRKLNETARGAYWYSPDVKAIVKRIEEVSDATMNMELISYSLK